MGSEGEFHSREGPSLARKSYSGSIPILVEAKFHPHENETSRQVNDYFLEHWPFPNEKARYKFVKAGFPRVTCAYFPLALNDRIQYACCLLTLLFLVDDMLEEMSLEAGKEFNARLMKIFRGECLPNRSVAAEYITHELWVSMCSHDGEMAMEILEPLFEFMRAQTDRARLKPMSLGQYLQYREKDVGRALLESLMRFSMRLHVSTSELAMARPAALTCSKHLSVINDIWSYEKEVKASETAHEEGGVLCTSVAIMAADTGLPAPAAKRVLERMCREWEQQYVEQRDEILAEYDTPALKQYLLGLEYQMSGNEMWSSTTERYLVV